MTEETLQTSKGMRFERILTLKDREDLINLYLSGTSISAITQIYQIHHSSVHYHLKKAGVHHPGQIPKVTYHTLKFTVTPRFTEAEIARRARGGKTQFYIGRGIYLWDDGGRNFPKSYLEYLKRDRERNNVLTKNGIIDPKLTFLSRENYDTDVWKRKRSSSNHQSRREKIEVSNPVNNPDKTPVTV